MNITYTPAQAKAVNADKGVIRVIAGAGSGKTQTVAGHIKHVLMQSKPENILCITFSNAGAKEMRHKIVRELGEDPEGLTVQTFNSFGFGIVQDQYKELGYAIPVNVINDVQRFSIIRDLLEANPIYEWTGISFRKFTSANGYGASGALKIVSDIFNAIKLAGGSSSAPGVDFDGINTGDMNFTALRKVVLLYDKYDAVLKERGLVDFSDQEILAMKVIENDPDYLKNHFTYEHIVVDEYQDTSALQTEFCKYLKNLPSFRSLMVVGDDAQSIYSFRHTSPEFLINFPDYINAPHIRYTPGTNELPENRADAVQDIMLTDNYRSTQEILDAAGEALGNTSGIKKQLVAARGHGRNVETYAFKKRADEVKWIVDEIEKRIKAGTPAEDIAVIAYTKDELRGFADELTGRGIPAMFGAPENLFDNSRVQAILAFADYLQNPTDSADELIVANALAQGKIAILPSSERDAFIEKARLRASAIRSSMSEAEQKELFLDFISDIALDDEAIEHFVKAFGNLDFEESLRYCRDFKDLGREQEFRRLDAYPGVMLITAHSSKGLEWPIVYNSVDKYQSKEGSNTEERKRLLYVSMTRARDELYVTGTCVLGGKGKDKVFNLMLRRVFEALGKAHLFDAACN